MGPERVTKPFGATERTPAQRDGNLALKFHRDVNLHWHNQWETNFMRTMMVSMAATTSLIELIAVLHGVTLC